MPAARTVRVVVEMMIYTITDTDTEIGIVEGVLNSLKAARPTLQSDHATCEVETGLTQFKTLAVGGSL
jgi:hypothetical protein